MVWMRIVWEVVMLLRTGNRCQTIRFGTREYTYAVKEILGSSSSVLRGFFSSRSRTSWLDAIP